MKSKVLLLTFVLMLALDCGGCAIVEAAKNGGKSKDSDEWVTLPPKTGSNIPRRVRKSDVAAEEASSDNGSYSPALDQASTGMRTPQSANGSAILPPGR
jgi:hypothetical protein